MSEITGEGGKVLLGDVTIAALDEWFISGTEHTVVGIPTPFSETTKKYNAVGIVESGKIGFAGNYDPADTAGQIAIATACQAGTELTDLYLYIDDSNFWRVAVGGKIIVTIAQAISLERGGVGDILFEGQVSGKEMQLVNIGPHILMEEDDSLLTIEDEADYVVMEWW